MSDVMPEDTGASDDAPDSISDSGAQHVRCTHCKLLKLRSDFSIDRRRKEGRSTWCKSCHREYREVNREHRQLQRQQYKSKRREFVWKMKQHPCTDCGSTFHPAAMQFDHLPSFTKSANISRLVQSYGDMNDQRLLDEIAKCELVCANCHAIRSWERLHNV